MKLSMYQIDAFTSDVFKGNPAAVVPLESWLEDNVLQSIAAENNLSETAFFVKEESGFHIRWFSPVVEVSLCGHATLATAFVLFSILDYQEDTIIFDSRSGLLYVTQSNGLLCLNFPVLDISPYSNLDVVTQAVGEAPLECYGGRDLIAIFDSEERVASLKPNYSLIERLELHALVVTAPSAAINSDSYDFVARFFAPKSGIPEDPVTGSAYTQLMPYWVERLGQKSLKAKQLSSRSGLLSCELKNDRVLISGEAVKYMEGVIEI